MDLKRISIYLLMVTLFLACESTDKDPVDLLPDTTDKYLLKSYQEENSGMSIDFYSDYDIAYAGNNQFFVVIKDAEGELIEDAELTWNPMMQMDAGHMHATPVYQPTFNSESKFQEGNIIFIMPSMGGSWNITFNLTVDGQLYEWTDSWMVEDMQMHYQTQKDIYQTMIRKEFEGTRYFFSYYFKEGKPSVGSNQIYVTAHRMVDMMTFESLDQLEMTLTPWMPSMGHGSSNNENPVYSESTGTYEGIINFNMTGDWQLQFSVKDGEQTILEGGEDQLSFYLEF